MLIQDVPLEPNFSVESCANFQTRSAQGSPIHQNFKIQAIEIKVNPKELAARKRIDQRLERDNAS